MENTPQSAARPLRLGTRRSALARWQADWVAEQLRQAGVLVELEYITTEGDVKSGPLGQIGGQGLFTKVIQQALLDDRIDLAVHSLKDLPTETVAGLQLAASPEREAPGDALLSNIAASIDDLPQGARIGTGSMRRKAQLLHRRPDLQVSDIRGNLDTRIKKLDDGEFDAIILAVSGLTRMGWQDRIAQVIPLEVMLPAVGQGALGLEIRQGDDWSHQRVAPLSDVAAMQAVTAERSLLAALRGGCLAPVGAYAQVADGQVSLQACVLSGDGSQRVAAAAVGPAEQAALIGEQVAGELLSQGAAALIASARSN
ncbi:hydroxymethylbilane synthase [Lignipirellula cremea]|uniref:Porphobilinogen deaminase n=1 Tax=Lignipirellula cremea TaxID=2528010 RepID=A0A518DUA5_9BACT|nr:hydroxymethylbilane synthase [Lignipirellula cremea]QDU95415.1 Porphobilinogen deaminase [Lignipirellula cremea]